MKKSVFGMLFTLGIMSVSVMSAEAALGIDTSVFFSGDSMYSYQGFSAEDKNDRITFNSERLFVGSAESGENVYAYGMIELRNEDSLAPLYVCVYDRGADGVFGDSVTIKTDKNKYTFSVSPNPEEDLWTNDDGTTTEFYKLILSADSQKMILDLAESEYDPEITISGGSAISNVALKVAEKATRFYYDYRRAGGMKQDLSKLDDVTPCQIESLYAGAENEPEPEEPMDVEPEKAFPIDASVFFDGNGGFTYSIYDDCDVITAVKEKQESEVVRYFNGESIFSLYPEIWILKNDDGKAYPVLRIAVNAVEQVNGDMVVFETDAGAWTFQFEPDSLVMKSGELDVTVYNVIFDGESMELLETLLNNPVGTIKINGSFPVEGDIREMLSADTSFSRLYTAFIEAGGKEQEFDPLLMTPFQVGVPSDFAASADGQETQTGGTGEEGENGEDGRQLYTDADTVKQVQEVLNELGYECGTPDGISGAKTEQAIAQYREAFGLQSGTGIDDELLDSMGL